MVVAKLAKTYFVILLNIINYLRGNVIGFPNNKDQVNKSPRSEDMLGQRWPLS